MTFQRYRYLIYADLYRITGVVNRSTLVRYVLRGGAFRYVFWLRTCAFAHATALRRFTLGVVARAMLKRLTYRLGISIPPETSIDSGFYIGHFGGIVVNAGVVIGKNCNISHGVTLGQANRGAKAGVPTLGDNVYLGPGAKVVGAISIGDDVAIGANCVVTKDVPAGSVVVGIPGKVISQEGSAGYVNRTDYDRLLR